MSDGSDDLLDGPIGLAPDLAYEAMLIPIDRGRRPPSFDVASAADRNARRAVAKGALLDAAELFAQAAAAQPPTGDAFDESRRVNRALLLRNAAAAFANSGDEAAGRERLGRLSKDVPAFAPEITEAIARYLGP